MGGSRSGAVATSLCFRSRSSCAYAESPMARPAIDRDRITRLTPNRMLGSIHKQALRHECSAILLHKASASQDGQNVRPTNPQPTAAPQAYPQGYVEDVAEVRTQLGSLSLSELKKDTTDDPMSVIRHVDEEPGEVHLGQLRSDIIFGKRGQQ